MRRTAKNMKFFFGSTLMFNGKEPLKVFPWLQEFVKACDDNGALKGMGLHLIPNFSRAVPRRGSLGISRDRTLGAGMEPLGPFPRRSSVVDDLREAARSGVGAGQV